MRSHLPTAKFDVILEKTNWTGFSFYTVSWSYWHQRGGYVLTEEATFDEYSKAKKFFNEINAGA